VGGVWKRPKHGRGAEIEVVDDRKCSRRLISVPAEIVGGRCCWSRRTPSTKIPSAALMMSLEQLHGEHKLVAVVEATL